MDGIFKKLTNIIVKPAKSVLHVGEKLVGLDNKKPSDDTEEIANQVTALIQTPTAISPSSMSQQQMLLLGGAGLLAVLLLKGKK